jgi:ribonucleoside-diphosphate reductase alpha chain
MVKITYLPELEDVYDITVTDNHNFFADGICVHNCVEIGMMPVTATGVSGFQFCNLTEINGGRCTTTAIFFKACKAAAVLGTLQAGYTNFKYVSEATKQITEHEALIGVSITGWMNNPDILFDKQVMIDGATLVKACNKQVARILGINQAARTTCAKPSGNASVLLGTASGIHGEHAPKYFRHVQINAEDEVAKIIMQVNPKMVEASVWSAGKTDVVVAFPVVTKAGSMYKADLLGVKQLEYVKLAQQYWVEAGTNVELCVHPALRHNISNTITVDNWDEVEQYIYDNRNYFAGISLLSSAGDRAYVQAPFAEVFDANQIIATYGEGSLFASGLVVDALHAFNENLWIACDTAMGYGMKLDEENSSDILKRDWVRRANKFASSYFDGDMQKMTFCLKDCYNLHKWNNIVKTFKPIEFAKDLSQKQFTEVDTLAGATCFGGVCEISF